MTSHTTINPDPPTGLSRLSSTLFFLLFFTPVLAMILFGAVDQVTWALLSVIWAVLIVIWALQSVRSGALALRRSSLFIPLLGLLAIGLVQLAPVSTVRSIDTALTFYFDVRLMILLTFFAGYLTLIDSGDRLRKAVSFVVIFGAAMAFFGILQRLANPDGIYGIRSSSAAITFGPFVNQHHFAGFVEMTGGLTLGLLFGRKTSRDHRILLSVAAIVMGAAVAFTGSRGGMLSFAAVLVFVLLIRYLADREKSEATTKNTLSVAVGAGALILATVSLVLYLGGSDPLLRGSGIATPGEEVSTGRFHFWSIALQIFRGNPIFGTGLDTFALAFTKFDTWPGIFRVERAHNEYLQILADAGILGFLCVLSFIILLFKKGLNIIAATKGYRQYVSAGALAGCFGIIVHSFFDFPLRTYSNAFFFLMLAAIATVPVVMEERTHHRHRRHRSDAT